MSNKVKDVFDYPVNKDGPLQPHMDTRCWQWLGPTNKDGYGICRLTRTKDNKRSPALAHRVVMGNPAGQHVLHRCDNRSCVNPLHLWFGSQSDNMKDMWGKGRGVRIAGAARWWKTKLTEQVVLEIRSYSAQGCRNNAIAEFFGMSPKRVSDIIRGTYWKCLPVGGVS